MKNIIHTVKELFARRIPVPVADLTSAASSTPSKRSARNKPVNLQFSSRARRTMEWSRYHIGGLH